MTTVDLLEIQPRELKFTFEVKKQSSCFVRLLNSSQHHVAFKVKTTSPKKYCVCPNVGIVAPFSACDFTVTMQAQREASPDQACKDKFLVQGTIVPAGTTEEGITSGLFVKDGSKYIQESKLRVSLLFSHNSPDLSPNGGTLEEFQSHGASERNIQIDARENNPIRNGELEPTRDAEEMKLVEDIEVMKSKIDEFEFKLSEAEDAILKLTRERKLNVKEREALQQELITLTHIRPMRKVQLGFPFLFVCMVSFISVVIGYTLRA